MKLKFSLICFIILSSIGPYIGYGLRLEHVFIYGTILFLPLISNSPINKKLFLLLIPLLFSFSITFFFDLFTDSNARRGNLFSSIDNLIEPVLLIFISSLCLTRNFQETQFKKLLNLIKNISLLAAFISILTIFFDLKWMLKYYISDIDSDLGLWNQVYSLGRYIGLFTQPIEAGIFFSMALFVLVYMYKVRYIGKSSFYLSSIIILVGGMISLSKNFYLIAIVCAILLYGQLSYWKPSRYITLILISSLFIFIFIFSIDLTYTNYMNSLIEIYQRDGLTAALTAGRFGGDNMTKVEIMFNEFWHKGFFTGFGISSSSVLDNGFLEYAYQGGIFSLIGYIFFIINGFVISYINRKDLTSKFLNIIFVYVLIASVGGPVITSNRSNIIVLILICSLVVFKDNKLLKNEHSQ
jgi:hypothetical protein